MVKYVNSKIGHIYFVQNIYLKRFDIEDLNVKFTKFHELKKIIKHLNISNGLA